MNRLHRSGQYRALYANLETALAAQADIEQGVAVAVQTLAMRAQTEVFRGEKRGIFGLESKLREHKLRGHALSAQWRGR